MENESVVNEEAMARKTKTLISNIQPKVTTLKLPNGEYTEIGKETCIEMMSKPFPTHTSKTDPEYHYTKINTADIYPQNTNHGLHKHTLDEYC